MASEIKDESKLKYKRQSMVQNVGNNTHAWLWRKQPYVGGRCASQATAKRSMRRTHPFSTEQFEASLLPYLTFDLPTESLELVSLPTDMVINVFRRDQRLIVGISRTVKQFDKGADQKGWS